MISYVAFLRGINVGGHRKVPMAELRTICARVTADAGARSYIASGNLVFQTALPVRDLAQGLKTAIVDHFGFDVSIVIIPEPDMRRILANGPFKDAPGNQVHAFFCLDTPIIDHARIDRLKRATDQLVCVERTVWVFTPQGVATSKLMAGMDTCIGGATGRNLNTVRKVVEMLDG